MAWPRVKPVEALPPTHLVNYWPFQYGKTVLLLRFIIIFSLCPLFVCPRRLFALFRIAWWPSAGIELSSWLPSYIVSLLMLSLVFVFLSCLCLGRVVKIQCIGFCKLSEFLIMQHSITIIVFCAKWHPEHTWDIWAATWQDQQSECAPSEDSDHPGHPPSLIRVFTVRMKKAWVLSYQLSAQRRFWSDWVNEDWKFRNAKTKQWSQLSQ